MKNFILIVGFILISSFAIQAQTTTKIKVAGNCGMCKGNIEKAAKQAGAVSANWDKAAKIISEINWVDRVSFDTKAFSASQNGIRVANYKTRDGYYILWLHLYDDQKHRIAVSIETTGYTDKHLEDSLRELRERLGHLL